MTVIAAVSVVMIGVRVVAVTVVMATVTAFVPVGVIVLVAGCHSPTRSA
ncbi:MAG: hypothetical protein Q7T17_02375 [Microbacterium sp.]|nr:MULTISPECIES: hypothetical protein [unclassified Microbacterium]MDO8381817.1 hypothetical protein [Microbacterium sp.]